MFGIRFNSAVDAVGAAAFTLLSLISGLATVGLGL
jgi:hypothetical protein